jgi:hypothetical protein
MSTDAHASGEREWTRARQRDFTARLEGLERRLRSAIRRHPAAALTLTAVVGVSLGLLPRSLKLAALALSARALAPLALRKLDSAFFEDASNDPHRRM